MPITDFNVAPIQTPDVLQKAGQLMQLRALAGEQQMRQQQIQGAEQENQIRQQQINDMNGIHQALNDSGGDPDKLRSALADPKYGISPNGQFSTVKMLNDYKLSQYQVDEAARKNSIDSDNTIADAYNKIHELPTDQQPSAVQDLKSNTDFLSKLTPHGQQAVAGFQYAGPDSLTTMANSHTVRGTLVEQAQKEQQTKTSAQQQATSAQEQQTSKATQAKTEAETVNLKEGANQAVADARYRNIQMKVAQNQPVTADDKAFVSAYEKQKTLGQAFLLKTATDLNQQGLDMLTEQFLRTGQLQNVGYGSAGTALRTAVVNNVQNFLSRHPEMGDLQNLAAGSAAYAANKKTYGELTDTLAKLQGFESSAGENLDQFLSLTDKLPDTGVPWLNTPVRLLNDKLVGQQWMPAINAAKEVALREIARVTNDPKLVGALTDTARAEVQNFSPANATLPQIKNVIQVLRTDMKNVEGGLSQQRDTVGNRIGINPGSQQAGSPTAEGQPQAITQQTASGQASIPAPKGKSTVYDPHGVQHFVDSDKLKAFLADPKYKGWHQ